MPDLDSKKLKQNGLPFVFNVHLPLILTWMIIGLLIAAITEGRLAPWDTARFRPPPGTWVRTLNDFFANAPGSSLPTLVVVAFSAILYWKAYSKSATARPMITWAFVATNLVFIILVSSLVVWVTDLNNSLLPQPRPPIDIGYHKTWPAIAVTGGLSLLLLVSQGVIVFAKRYIGHRDI